MSCMLQTRICTQVLRGLTVWSSSVSCSACEVQTAKRPCTPRPGSSAGAFPCMPSIASSHASPAAAASFGVTSWTLSFYSRSAMAVPARSSHARSRHSDAEADADQNSCKPAPCRQSRSAWLGKPQSELSAAVQFVGEHRLKFCAVHQEQLEELWRFVQQQRLSRKMVSATALLPRQQCAVGCYRPCCRIEEQACP